MIPIRTSVEVQDIPGAVIGLIVGNVAVFVFQSGLPDDLARQFIVHNGLLPVRYTDPDVARELGLSRVNVLPFLTSLFMHADWLHLIVNMWTLWLFGRAIEERLGAPRFVLFYLACGLISGLAHFAFNLDSGVPALGASGAIAGILGAYTLIYPTARIAIVTPILFFPVIFHLPAAVYTTLWFVFQVAWGIADFSLAEDVGGIAWWAHAGGFAAGVALIGAIGGQRRRIREISIPRPGVREIGAPRARTITNDNRARGGPQPKSQTAGTPPREASRPNLVRRLAKKGRSVIPQSGA
jgi:membrane associated rhomboid family serine protease